MIKCKQSVLLIIITVKSHLSLDNWSCTRLLNQAAWGWAAKWNCFPSPMQMKVHQEHIKRIFDSKNIPYEEIDIADPQQAKSREFMQSALKLNETDSVPLPPQLFNNENYRGVNNITFGVWKKQLTAFTYYVCFLTIKTTISSTYTDHHP